MTGCFGRGRPALSPGASCSLYRSRRSPRRPPTDDEASSPRLQALDTKRRPRQSCQEDRRAHRCPGLVLGRPSRLAIKSAGVELRFVIGSPLPQVTWTRRARAYCKGGQEETLNKNRSAGESLNPRRRVGTSHPNAKVWRSGENARNDGRYCTVVVFFFVYLNVDHPSHSLGSPLERQKICPLNSQTPR